MFSQTQAELSPTLNLNVLFGVIKSKIDISICSTIHSLFNSIVPFILKNIGKKRKQKHIWKKW